MNRKGVEGLPLKYIAIILMAVMIFGAVIAIAGNLSATATQATHQTNQTLNAVLNKSLGNMINRTVSP
jgi:hypothetical protein